MQKGDYCRGWMRQPHLNKMALAYTAKYPLYKSAEQKLKAKLGYTLFKPTVEQLDRFELDLVAACSCDKSKVPRKMDFNVKREINVKVVQNLHNPKMKKKSNNTASGVNAALATKKKITQQDLRNKTKSVVKKNSKKKKT